MSGLIETLLYVLTASALRFHAVRSESDIRKVLSASDRPAPSAEVGIPSASTDDWATPDDAVRSVGVHLRSESVAELKVLSAMIRRESGAVLTMSAIVRALIDWFAGGVIDARGIRNRADLAIHLGKRLRGE